MSPRQPTDGWLPTTCARTSLDTQHAVELSWYLVSSFSHELLGRHLPDGRNCDHPSHIVVVKLPTCLIAQLLREGVYFRNTTQTIQVRRTIYSHADVWDEKVNSVTEGVAVRTGRVAHLECLLLKECQCIRKDIQSLYSFPIGCVQVSLDGQVLVAETRKMHWCRQFWRNQKSTTSFWK